MSGEQTDPLLQRILDDIGVEEREGRRSGKARKRPRRRAGGSAPFAVRSKGTKALTDALESALSRVGRVEELTHGFHTYPAGLHPLAARDIIAACPGAVHDPFCGGGTVLVEAVRAGERASGTDLSPIATRVACTRTAGPEWATPVRSAARKLAERARVRRPVDLPLELEPWYEPHVAQELGRLVEDIRDVEEPVLRGLLEVVLSSILVKVSYRESDTRNRRVTHHRAPGTTPVLFHKKARELGRMLETMPEKRAVKVRVGDAGSVGPPPDTALILTSPPYPGVYDYLPMQQLRLLWLDLDASAGLRQELGSRRSFRALGRAKALQKWRGAHHRWIACQAAGLTSGGRIAIVVGDGLVGDKPVDTLSPTADAIAEAGLRIVARSSADRPDHARGTVRTEHIVLAEKP